MNQENPQLVDIPVDAVTNPQPTIPTWPGNLHDDDGPATDQYFEQAPAGPVASEGLAIEKESTPVVTRMLRGRINFAGMPTTACIQLFPPDLNRTYLRLQNSAAESFMVAGEPFNPLALVDGGNATAFLVAGSAPGFFELTNYTGSLWVSVDGVGGGNVILEWMTVTS